MIKKISIGVVLGFVAFSCQTKRNQPSHETPAADSVVSVSSKPYGKMKDGQGVMLYTLKNKHDVEVSIMNYGGIIQSIIVPDKNGVMEDVTLGYDSFPAYETRNQFFGALVGRYGNRIARGKFVLDGTTFHLAVNNGPNHLHGGIKGFDKVYWNVDVISKKDNPSLRLTYLSKDGEEGFPGNLNVEVIYTLTEDNEVLISYTATTDKKTIINLTNHTYFNLTGNARRDVLDHSIKIAAGKFVPVDKDLIPTGKLASVIKTPFDFNNETLIGSRINDNDPQIKAGRGYDHCWVFSNTTDSLKKVATVYEPVSRRVMELYTTEPAVQFYTGNFLNGSVTGKKGVVYKQRYGFCLETEHYPDSPNQPSFPSVTLAPGQTYRTMTAYRFSVR